MTSRLIAVTAVMLLTLLTATSREAGSRPPSTEDPRVVEKAGPPPAPGDGAPPLPDPTGDDAADEEAQAPPEGDDQARQEQPEQREYHAGFFFRFRLGLGWSWMMGQGALRPAKGLRLIEDPAHDSPAFNLALDLGGGFRDLALHLGVLYERMILRADEPEELGFSLFGLGGGLTYYFTDNDFFATADVRLIGMLLFLPGVICEDYHADKFEAYRGPGVSLTIGKEWFGGGTKGIGLGIQGGYARLEKDGGGRFDYASVMLVLVVTRF